jgi:hypothetical protein
MGEQRFAKQIATSPLRPTGFSGFGTTSRNKNTPKMKKRR